MPPRLALAADAALPPGPIPPVVAAREGRPLALVLLWVALLVPLSIVGALAQPLTPVPYEVLPLVMAGPAVAALVCALVVPGWFPADHAAASSRRIALALGGTVLAGAVFSVVARSCSPAVPRRCPRDGGAPEGCSR